MTENERQQVIQALEKAIGTCFTEYAYRQFMSDPNHFMRQALAIMQRERKPVGVVRPDGNTFRLLMPLPAGTPIFKD